jgi:uncharacterized protein (TIGR02757 family)
VLKELLEEKYFRYNKPEFMEEDPVCIPHRYDRNENIEIAGFLSASLAWGQRKTIIRNAGRLMSLMGNDPYEYLLKAGEKDLIPFKDFTHRTFMGTDAVFFIKALAYIYREQGGIGRIFGKAFREEGTVEAGIIRLRKIFFSLPHKIRTEKHFADITRGAAAKRLNMFLRWMVRRDKCGIDFGIWNEIPPSALYIPLDVHTGRVARELGLLKRKQNDWKAVMELTGKLREFDPLDPVKYDFALFGMGVYETDYKRAGGR